MKIVMVNDCAHVGETILKYLPSSMGRQHITRTRGAWDKTLGLAHKILKSRGDLYHVHYLLQDCYITARLGKRPLIGHAHGSDLRSSLKHPLWGRIVSYNLHKCDTVLVSTPDILDIANESAKRAEYLPNPVNTELFHPKPLVPHTGPKRVLIASNSSWSVKGTDMAMRALSKIRDDVEVSIIAHGADFARTMTLALSLGLGLKALPMIPHEELNNYYWNADVVIDRFKLDSLGMVSLEAIACGRPVVTHVSSHYREYADFPLKDISTEEEIISAVQNADATLWQKQYAYLRTHHEPQEVVHRLLDLYDLTAHQS